MCNNITRPIFSTMASVLSEYLRFFNEYSDKYGSRVAVLMQVGSFYEMYGADSGKCKLSNAEELSRILNIVLTRRNKKLPANSVNNPLMLGFPCLALSKYTPVLLDEDYTVVVVDQVKTALSIRRAVVSIVSPSMYMDAGDPASTGDNYLVLIHVDRHRHVGMSAISVLTGSSVVHECYSEASDGDRPLDDALAFVKQYRPREAVLSGERLDGLVSYLELDSVMCHAVDSGRRKLSVEYQNSVLGLAFKGRGMLSNIEHLGLEKMPCALLSYVLLIEFVYDHNPMLLRRMSHPDMFSSSNRLVLSTSTVDQLNIAAQTSRARLYGGNPRGGKSTLLGVVNRCITSAGQRLLMRRILAPSVDPAQIRRRYDQVEGFGVLFAGDHFQRVDELLKRVVDIERLQRRMSVGIMVPSELTSLAMSYEAALELDGLLKSKIPIGHCLESVVMHNNCKERVDNFVGMCRYAFDLDSMPSSEATFNSGVFEELDRLKGLIQLEKDRIVDFALSIGIDSPRIEHSCSKGHWISITGSQAKAVMLAKSKKVVIKTSSSSSRVTSPAVDAASRNIASLSEELKSCTSKLYKATLECLMSYKGVSEGVVSFVSHVDVARSNLCTSKLYSYCKPVVASEGPSFLDAKGLRHPVIERIDNGNVYVPNDITIGKDCNGIVLYSMNSCGKTSLLRAVGLSVILAQAGCYVPASSFTFMPFKCIMTRILSRDNIMKGQSSFVAEMTELRAILKRAKNASTLVLADEITHGTEHTSGSSIFVSSVETLAKRQANFLFTTHLHNVYPFIKDISNLRVLHLSVAFEDKDIVFERKLKEGPGGSVYGLEVCEFLGMDTEFVARAFQVRAMITPDKADDCVKPVPKPSRYNSKKMVQQCEVCGYRPRLPTDSPLDVHHVKHRLLADDNGMITGVHKNALSNLRVLCKKCHTIEHK